MERININHKMVIILFYIKSINEKWLTSAEISNNLKMDYKTFKISRDNLVFLRLLKEEKRGSSKFYSLNFNDM